MVLTASLPRHVPVLLDRCAELLRPGPGRVLVDATLGLGGHAERLLQAGAHVIGLDRDPDALQQARARLAGFGERFTPVHASFAALAAAAAAPLARLGREHADGVLYDLGVSSLQLDDAARGFSYRQDAPLDMRMDPTGSPSAADVVNTYPEQELARILRDYGEERFARRIAHAIHTARARSPIHTTGELADLVKTAIPAATRRTGPHPARRTFQALRIEVNAELDALTSSLPQAIELLAPGGRLVALAYHSLEDRIVKRALAAAAAGAQHPPRLPVPAHHAAAGEPALTLLTRRPETPSAAEVAANPRAESAKLRAAEKRPTRPSHPPRRPQDPAR